MAYVERALETSKKNEPRLVTKTAWVVAPSGVESSLAPVYTPERTDNLPFANGRVNREPVVSGMLPCRYHSKERRRTRACGTNRPGNKPGGYTSGTRPNQDVPASRFRQTGIRSIGDVQCRNHNKERRRTRACRTNRLGNKPSGYTSGTRPKQDVPASRFRQRGIRHRAVPLRCHCESKQIPRS